MIAALFACDGGKVETVAPATTSTLKVTASSTTTSAEPADPTVTVTFVGDLNLALKVGINLAKPKTIEPGYPFAHVADRLRSADLLVGNLECVASRLGSLATSHNPFRCPLAIEVLKEAGFDLVSVANNHALDFGQQGFRDMLQRLDTGGLPHFGQENLDSKPQAVTVRVVGGLRIGLLAYFRLPSAPYDDVRKARPLVDVLFTFMHWGREDEPRPLKLQRDLAQGLIDAGVDVVVGTHAHVPQPTELYEGKVIAYGLGNFVFSGMTHTELHRTGIVLEVDIHKQRGVMAHRELRVRLGEDGAPRFVYH
jgi:poly-gamma-glutamate capsule biosynthesis protein CapA/YwtB (metallophosphatase superfamily)